MYENSLETDLKGDTSGDLEALLVELSKVRRSLVERVGVNEGCFGIGGRTTLTLKKRSERPYKRRKLLVVLQHSMICHCLYTEITV